MKIEWMNKTKIPFSHVSPGQCFLDEDDNLCLSSYYNLSVNLSTRKMFELQAPHGYDVRLVNTKIVVL